MFYRIRNKRLLYRNWSLDVKENGDDSQSVELTEYLKLVEHLRDTLSQ